MTDTTTLTIPPATVVNLDLFPAYSEEAIDHIEKMRADRPIRVIATDSHLLIYAEIPGRKAGIDGPEPSIVTPLYDLQGRPNDGYIATTELGEFKITRMKHCGCGSALRSPKPYKGTPYMIQNTPLPKSLYKKDD